MLMQALYVCLAVFSVAAIKVPVESSDDKITTTASVIPENIIPVYYASDGDDVDSYLVPPDPNKPEESGHSHIATPATYLLPPAPDSKNDFYYKPTEPGEQTDWYPIVPTSQKQLEISPLVQEDIRLNPQEVKGNFRTGKVLNRDGLITIPPRNLVPPREDAPNEFVILSLSPNLELPSEEIDHTLSIPHSIIPTPLQQVPYVEKQPINFQVKPESVPVSYILPPKNNLFAHPKNHKRLYPKKFNGQFRPVPIPVSQFSVESMNDAGIARPVLPIRPILHYENEYQRIKEEKILHDQSEEKQKLKKQHELENIPNNKLSAVEVPTEQEASATNYRHPGRHGYPVRTNEELNEVPQHKDNSKSNGERTEFRMHGMKGPHSYQFGYDTGKGKNRQFRYEERDNDGHVRGHYGYVDKFGKLRVVNYDADPEHGFRAEVPAEKE